MKKVLILVLAAALIAGCVQAEKPATIQPEVQPETQPPAVEEPAAAPVPEEPAQPEDWGSPDYGAKSVYGYTRIEALNWNSDVFLVKVYSGDVQGGKSGKWIFDYYSPMGGKVLSVTAEGTEVSSQEKAGSYSELQKIGSWSTDSANAWVIAYNHGGKAYLEEHPGIKVSFELYKPADAGLRWKVDYGGYGTIHVNGYNFGVIS